METSSYYVSLEFYVKYVVNFKSLVTAKENGTYDKAITRLALDFTYKTSPSKRWGVKRSELIEDLFLAVEGFPKLNGFYTDTAGFAYVDNSGNYSAFAGTYDEMESAFIDLPDLARPIGISSMVNIVEFSSLTPTGFVTVDGDVIDAKCSPIYFLVNALDVCLIATQQNN